MTALSDIFFAPHTDLAFMRGAIRRAREGSYEGKPGQQVYFQDGETVQDAVDLYAVLEENYVTGSPNLENQIAREFVDALQAGQWLSEFQLGKLRQMLAKYAAEIAAHRASAGYGSQDPNNTPAPEQARTATF